MRKNIKRTILITCLAILISPVLVWAVVPSDRAEPSTPASPLTRAELLRLVNDERRKVGVAPLIEDERLNMSAQLKADDLYANNYFAHVNPLTKKNGPTYITDVAPTMCDFGSENLVWLTEDQSSTQAVFSWMNSKPHHDAMLDPKYIQTGFGIAGDKVVEHFCQPHRFSR